MGFSPSIYSKYYYMVKIEQLHKSYITGKNSLHVLKGIDLYVEEGEMVSIMGSSGSVITSYSIHYTKLYEK